MPVRVWNGVLAGVLFALLVPAPAVAQGEGSLLHDGVERRFLLHVPEGLGPGAPLVIVLHGRGGTMEGMRRLTGFDAVADEMGFAVAYPQGLDAQWNYVAGVEGYLLESDDIGFLPLLAGTLASEHALDDSRMFVVGFSNGGFMAQRLACEARDVFAGFASVAAAGFAGLPAACADPGPLSLLLMHGTEDSVVPFGGLQAPSPAGPVTLLASVEQTLTFWAAFSGCTEQLDATSVPQRGRSPGTSVQVLDVVGCPVGRELQLVVVQGGGHNWPGRQGMLPGDVAGRVNLDIDASRHIAGFLMRQAPVEEPPLP